MDTFFSSVKAIGGATCAQIYVGAQSGYTRLYGMTSENEFKYSYQDFIRDTGAPSQLKSNNALNELSKDIVTLCRMYKIDQATSEPHNQRQNPAEHRIQEIKAATNALMNSTNAPEELWFLACSHICSVLKIIATKKNYGRSAVEACLGETPGISVFIQFHFLQPVMYLTHPAFLNSRERSAYWITPAKHCGDALTYIIRNAETGELLKRSVMRHIDEDRPNFRMMKDVLATSNDDTVPIPSEVGEVVLETSQESITSSVMPALLNPIDAIGKQFVLQDSSGTDVKASVLDYDHVDQKCHVLIEASGEEQEMTYDDVIDFIENSDSNPTEAFQCLSSHQRKAGAWQVQVTPMMEHYHPEEEVEMEVTEDKRKWYTSMVGMGSWCAQLCCIDIAYAVNSMALYQHSPSESHLSVVLRIFAYVKSRGAASIQFRNEVPGYSLLGVEEYDLIQQYGDIREEVPYFAIKSKGQSVRTMCFVDTNHARCTATRRSTTGIIHFINSTPFEWTSKKQSIVEASTYGAEFVALRLAVEQIWANMTFLRSIGVSLDGPTWVLYDNLAVVRSVSAPDQVLKKKHLAVAF